MLRLRAKSAIFSIMFFWLSTAPAFAQAYMPDDADLQENTNQVDITRGLAEQNAYRAMSKSAAFPQLTGQIEVQSTYGFQNPQPSTMQAQSAYNQYGMVQGAAGSMPVYGAAAPVSGMQAQQFQSQNFMPQTAAPNQGNSFGITGSQVAGMVGAAVLFNYMSNGGMSGLLNSTNPRGWNTRRGTLGSCIGGNVYH